MNFRPYTTPDYEACLHIFDSNVPLFFAPEERTEFAEFLAQPLGSYFVLTDEAGKVVACGGYGDIRGVGVLTWGMVRRDLHKQGLGRLLIRERIEHLKRSRPDITEIRMNTSQHSVNFFEREGFRATRITLNGFAPGLHEYHLRLEIGARSIEK
jgi:ribosomal protein S18 acetylase RimI-like enzyme